MSPLVEVSGLSISLGGGAQPGRRILTDVTFEVPRGAFLSIVGRNGAGKSTLFKCMLGIYGTYEGTVRIDGKLSSEMCARERARHIAYVPQSAPQDTPYTVEEFMEMSRYPWRGIRTATEDRDAVREAMGLTGIGALAARRLASLSGGERQKVLIAAAIAQGASCVLMDEPTTYLDYAHQIETMEILSDVNRRRQTTLMIVTHDVNMAIQRSSWVVALSEGRVEWQGCPNALLEPDRVERIYGVPFERYVAEGKEGSPVVVPVGGREVPTV